MADVAEGRVRGAILRMENSVREVHIKAGVGVGQPELRQLLVGPGRHPGALIPDRPQSRLPGEFDLIVRHGYELAERS